MNKKHIIGYAATTVVALAIGAAASGGEGTETATASEPVPTPTVTVTQPPQPPVTETVEVEVTPQACLDALDYAGQLLEGSAEFANITGRTLPLIEQALMAGLDYDVAAVEAITAELDSINADLDALIANMPDDTAVAEAASACRAGQ